MKKYTPIHVGTRWATEHTWGVMVEGVKPSAELLCVGCTQAQAEGMAAKLNERPVDTVRLKMVAPVVAVMLAYSLCIFCRKANFISFSVSQTSFMESLKDFSRHVS